MATKDWVLVLDADEQLSDHLNKSIHNFLNSNTSNKFNAYSLSRKLVFMDRKMNYGKTSDNPIRLFRRGMANFQGEIHEKLIVENNAVSSIPGELLHYSYRDITDYFNRFNRYIRNCKR